MSDEEHDQGSCETMTDEIEIIFEESSRIIDSPSDTSTISQNQQTLELCVPVIKLGPKAQSTCNKSKSEVNCNGDKFLDSSLLVVLNSDPKKSSSLSSNNNSKTGKTEKAKAKKTPVRVKASGTDKVAAPKKRFMCTVTHCHYSTPYGKDLARHMRKHTGEKPFSCDRCTKSFSRYDKLVMHIRIHDGNRPYKCECCEYAAVDSGSLRKHLRTHTDERPYKCQICPYSAKDSSQLIVHLRHHTGDTPYLCMHDMCDAAFKTPSDLQRHSRLHTGEKPYGCSLCDYRAAVKCNLNTHMQKYHKLPKSSKNSSPMVTDTDKLVPTIPASTAMTFESTTPFPILRESTVIKSKLSKASTSDLPFQFACKLCSFKADTLKLFTLHMKRQHKDPLEMTELLNPKQSLNTKGKGATKKRSSAANGELEKFFECSLCSAAFVREDSLRCHMRQHSDPTILRPVPVFPRHSILSMHESQAKISGQTVSLSIPKAANQVSVLVTDDNRPTEAIRTEVITYTSSTQVPGQSTIDQLPV